MNNRDLRFQPLRFDDENTPISPIHLNSEEIHIWGCSLDIDESEVRYAVKLLSEDELAKANRFVSPQHRRHFLAAHAGLRRILSLYSGVLPAELVIQRAPAGKPFLRDWPSICFNLSHSYDRALVAVAQDRKIGIDLEKVRPEVDVVRLAKRFLSVKDQVFIEQGGSAHQHERFLKAWVTREAVFKATGTGLTFPLDQDHIELTEDETAGHLVSGSGSLKSEIRSVRFLTLNPGWVGAIAAEGTDWVVRYCE